MIEHETLPLEEPLGILLQIAQYPTLKLIHMIIAELL
jgi:hypothetical protein